MDHSAWGSHSKKILRAKYQTPTFKEIRFDLDEKREARVKRGQRVVYLKVPAKTDHKAWRTYSKRMLRHHEKLASVARRQEFHRRLRAVTHICDSTPVSRAAVLLFTALYVNNRCGSTIPAGHSGVRDVSDIQRVCGGQRRVRAMWFGTYVLVGLNIRAGGLFRTILVPSNVEVWVAHPD